MSASSPWQESCAAPRGRWRAMRQLALWVGLLLCAATASGQDPEPLRIRALGNQFGFPDAADDTRLVWVFLGGVEVRRGPKTMLGRKLVVTLRREGDGSAAPSGEEDGVLVPGSRVLEFYLEGDVSLEEADASIIGAQAIYADNVSGEMLIEGGTWRADTGGDVVYVHFETMRRFADGTRELTGVMASTCSSCDPDWSFNTGRATLQDTSDGTVLHTAGNIIDVGGLPVFWLPGLHFNVDKDRPPLRSVGFGSSNRLGTEIETVWGGDADEVMTRIGEALGAEGPVSGDWEFALSNYTKRGVFYEPSWTYETESSKGRLFGAYIRDRASQDFRAEANVFLDDKSRGRVDLEHRTVIDENRVIDAEVSYLSDGGFLREYYESESRIGKEQETYVNYRDVKDNRAYSILARGRLNDHQDQVEYLPRLEARLAGERLDAGVFGNPVLTTVNFVDAVRRAPAELPPDFVSVGVPPVDVLAPVRQEDSSRNTRIGSRTQLTWPFDTEGGDRLRLTAAVDLTAFDNTLETPDDTSIPNIDTSVEGGSEGRYALIGGAEWSRTYSGVGDAQSDTWNIDGVRQLLEPRAGYMSVFELNRAPSELIPFDDTETLAKMQRFEVGLRHRIQTHQAGAVATVLDTDVSMPFYPDENRDNQVLNYDNDGVDHDLDGDTTDFPETIPGRGRTSGNLLVDTRWRPGADVFGLRNATVRWRSELDPNGWLYVRSFLSYETLVGEGKSFSIAENKAIHVADYLSAGFQWVLTDRWTTAVFAQQDQRRNELARAGFVVRQIAECWVMDLEVSERRGRRGGSPSGTVAPESRNDTRVSLRFWPRVGGRLQRESLLESLGTVR